MTSKKETLRDKIKQDMVDFKNYSYTPQKFVP